MAEALDVRVSKCQGSRYPSGFRPDRLVEHRATVGQGDGSRVAEAPDPLQGAEIVVEAAVLLHEQDYVLDL